jgi:hypothetical protein
MTPRLSVLETLDDPALEADRAYVDAEAQRRRLLYQLAELDRQEQTRVWLEGREQRRRLAEMCQAIGSAR